MKNSMIYKIKTGQDLFSGSSYGNESFNYNLQYDEEYVTALEALEIYLEARLDYAQAIATEDWDFTEVEEFILADESAWTTISAWAKKVGDKISGPFKSLWEAIKKKREAYKRLKNMKNASQQEKDKLVKEIEELERKALKEVQKAKDKAEKVAAADKNISRYAQDISNIRFLNEKTIARGKELTDASAKAKEKQIKAAMKAKVTQSKLNDAKKRLEELNKSNK